MLDNFFPYYIATFLLSLTFTAVLEKKLIPKLRSFAAQPIYVDGPKWHSKKRGTPTMGGLAFLIAVITSLCTVLVFFFIRDKREDAISILISLFFCIANALVGIIDDVKKLRSGRNEAGLTPRQKLILQFAIGIGFLLARAIFLNENGDIIFSFGTYNIGLFYYPLALLLIVGVINFANLTDGIDGLAAGVTFSIGVSLFYISCAISSEVSFMAAAVMGSSLGFLIFNLHPAKIFMGDTGSLFFGALVIAGVFALKNPLLIIAIGGVYIIEGISVILQVLYFKKTGKRLFLMAPIHHHLEQMGWSENAICIAAILITLILSIPAYVVYLP